ncbi:MAG TPA: Nif3-like dinuclear metal center hexameric protein [Steroidobacteraceae bacterium]|jgi:putative NIF3 family GTP cyclohydrolase 1 type 2
MDITRRFLLIAGATLAAAGSARALQQADGGSITAGQVVERIRNKVGIPWMTDTVDRIVAGDADLRVKGIATTMMATLDVVQRAAAAGKNMVITHEPTFFSHQDSTQELLKDPTFRFKSDFIATHDMAVFRFHDHWHLMTPDGIATGMTQQLGWNKHADANNPGQFVFPPTTLREFAATMATRLDAHSMRISGDPKLPVRRVSASWGYASLMPDLIHTAARPDVDLIIVGETREWELVEYVQDQIASGANKALIVVNHIVSEQAGMSYCAQWLRRFIPEVPIEFIATHEPFWQSHPSR